MAEDIQGLNSSYDAIVVGARCAGASTAMLLARAGMRVLLLEQGRRGADTLSTHALMRAGVLQLARWGLLDAIVAAATPRIETTTFHYGEESIAIRIKPRDGVDALYAPRRTLIDPLLADAAREAGAEVLYHTRVTGLRRDRRGRIRGVVVERDGLARAIDAGIVLGADGVNSFVASDVGAAAYRLGRHPGGVIFTRAQGLPADGYHWYFVPGASVGVIPTNGGESLVFAAMTHDRFMTRLRFDLAAGFAEILREASPALAGAMRALRVSPYRGFAGRPGHLRPAWGPGWALVGDAGYFKDPITAHGMTDALRDAELLARAVVAGTDAALEEYQQTRDDLSIRLLEISDDIAAYDWSVTELQALHKALSDEMAREVSHLRALAPMSGRALVAAAGQPALA